MALRQPITAAAATFSRFARTSSQRVAACHRTNISKSLANAVLTGRNTTVVLTRSISATPPRRLAEANEKTADVSSPTGGPTDEAKPASPKVEALFQKIIWLDVVEVHMLTELIHEKMGVTQSAAQRASMERVGGAGSSSGGGDEQAEQKKEERTAFDLKLTGFDAKAKIKVIKEIRAITSLGLKEAKEMVEGAPKVVKKDIKMEEAEELKTKLEAIGGTVEIV